MVEFRIEGGRFAVFPSGRVLLQEAIKEDKLS
jgi:hypothetical protein